jgi:hypothetical protein
VTIFVPLGKKSLPTIDSSTLLFPEDYPPTTTITGKSTSNGIFVLKNIS